MFVKREFILPNKFVKTSIPICENITSFLKKPVSSWSAHIIGCIHAPTCTVVVIGISSELDLVTNHDVPFPRNFIYVYVWSSII